MLQQHIKMSDKYGSNKLKRINKLILVLKDHIENGNMYDEEASIRIYNDLVSERDSLITK